jgi:pimeloyl-ACP methyl ester carboxylesterase
MNAVAPTETLRGLDLQGTRLAYRERGRGDPIVLVHANLGDLRSWELLEPLLAPHFRVINYSRRFAYPNAPIADGADDPLGCHADDLIALLERLRLGRAHLVGNSSGAFISLLAAQRRPDLVRTLTLEEPPVVSLFLQALPPTPGELAKLLFTSPAALVALMKFGAGSILPATQAFREGRDDEGLARFERGVLGAAAYAKITPARHQQMKDNAGPHRAALLGSGLPIFTPADARGIAIPTQLVRGSDTPSFQRHINQRLAALIPCATDVVIPGASHLVHEDQPRAVAEVIRSFCEVR